MTLHLDDWIVWDFWLADRLLSSEPYHLYFLQAPRDIPDPEDRHDLATVGHAVSTNLREWVYVGTALEPGSPGSWDDLSIWTGCVTRDADGARMFYTGRSREEGGAVQRIGIARSADLMHWERDASNWVLEADPRWYVAPGNDADSQSDCRDPWVIHLDDRFLMYYTASAAGVPRDARGVVGLAESMDLDHWTPTAPVTGTGFYGEMEVPQVFGTGQSWNLLFCTGKHTSRADRPTPVWNGTQAMSSTSPTGPFTVPREEPLLADEAGTFYAARLIRDPWDGDFVMAWRRWNPDGSFAGELTNPISVEIYADGAIRLTG